jgi:ribose transport system substrate-binding protein
MDPAKQASQIEDFVAQHVDAMIVAPCDSSAVIPYLARAEQAAIPVFTVDIAARGGAVVSHIASDNLAGGRLAAQTLARLIGERGEVIIIDHPEVASVQDRTRGFEEEMKGHAGVTIVGHPSASGQRAKAMAVMEDMLQANRNLRGVFAINDDSALGALSVLEAAKRTDIVIVGFDATAEAQDAIRRGSVLKADIAQHPIEIGKTTIDLVARRLAGEQVPPQVAVSVSVVDAASLSAGPIRPRE